jgi:hypothetical protein
MMPVRDRLADHRVDRQLTIHACYTHAGVI